MLNLPLFAGTKATGIKLGLIAAAAISFLFSSVLLLLIKYANISDLNHSRTVYFNGDHTLLVGEAFEIQFYDEFSIFLSPTGANSGTGAAYNVSVCQTECDDSNNKMTREFHFSETKEATSRRQYIYYPGFQHPSVPSLFLLSGSVVNFSFRFQDNSTIFLHKFTNVFECREFYFSDDNTTIPDETWKLTQNNNYEYFFRPKKDGYLCVVSELEQLNYSYSVNASIVQYQNVSTLKDNHLCELSNKGIYYPERKDGYRLMKKLRRSFTASQNTCIFITISDAPTNHPYSRFNMTSTILGTNSNYVVITVSALASLAFACACIFILCLFIYNKIK